MDICIIYEVIAPISLEPIGKKHSKNFVVEIKLHLKSFFIPNTYRNQNIPQLTIERLISPFTSCLRKSPLLAGPETNAACLYEVLVTSSACALLMFYSGPAGCCHRSYRTLPCAGSHPSIHDQVSPGAEEMKVEGAREQTARGPRFPAAGLVASTVPPPPRSHVCFI